MSPASARKSHIASTTLTLTGATALLLSACSGGDKIVDPGADGVSGNFRWNAADSSYLVNAVVLSANAAIKGIRNIQTPDPPSYGRRAPPRTPSSKTGGTDANNNGIPDDLTLQYLAATCSYVASGAQATVAGSLRIQDLGEIFAYRATYTNLVLTLTKGDTVVTTTVNGTIESHWASTTAASYVDKSSVVIAARSTNGSALQTRTANLSGLFTPASGSTITATRALPGGDMTFAGTLTVIATTSGNAVKAGIPTSITYNAAVSSTATLSVSAGCFTEPVFGAGGILSAPMTGTASGTVSLRFTGCGGVPSKS